MDKKCKNCGGTDVDIGYSNLMEKGTKTCNECGYVENKEEE